MNTHLLSRSALVSKSQKILIQALKNEDDVSWFKKLCALTDVLSDQQRCDVLEEKLKKYIDARVYALSHVKDPAAWLLGFQKKYKTTLSPQQYEQLLGEQIECLLAHNICPMKEKNQQKIWDQINTQRVGVNQTENICFQTAVNRIDWCPSVVMEITPYAVKGYYLYNFNNLFTKPVSEQFFQKNFQAIDWEKNISPQELGEKYLWMDALSVLPLKWLTQLLDRHPYVSQNPLFVDKAAYHSQCFKELLHLAYSKGMSVELVRSRLDDSFLMGYQDFRQKGFDFLEEVDAQQQKDILLANLDTPSTRPSKRKM